MIFNLAATFIFAVLFVPNVLGQAPTNTDTSGISACIINCIQSSLAAGGCTLITQYSCICTSIPFQEADGACIQNICPTEIAAAQQFQNATCGPYLAGLNSTSSSSSSSGIANTATTTIISTVTAAASADTTTVNPSPLPAIIGGTVGGAVLILFFLILFLWWRRRAARVKQARKQEIYDRRRLSGLPQQTPIDATYISPYTPPTPGRDNAPLMGNMSSTSSGFTPAPTTPGMSYFGGYNNLTTPGREEPAPWTIPVTSPVNSNSYNNNSVTSPANSNSYNNYGGLSPSLTESSSMAGRSPSISSRPDGLPPGSMLPRVNTGGRMVEKATFVPTRPPVVAPPPYTQGT